MALADPQSLPTTPSPTPLARVGAELGKFQSGDTTYDLLVTHAFPSNGRRRHVIRVGNRKISTDPLLPSQNREYSVACTFTIDHPAQGYSAAEVAAFAKLVQSYLGTSGLLDAAVQGQA